MGSARAPQGAPPPHAPGPARAQAEAPTVARVLYFSGVGLTIVYTVAFGYIAQAVFAMGSTTPGSDGFMFGLLTAIERTITTGLMVAGVLLFRTAPMERRLTAMGIVLFLPVFSLAVNTVQGSMASAVGVGPGAVSSALLLITSAAVMFAHAVCLLTAWNIVAGRAVSVHMIALCGAVGLTLVRAVVQAAALRMQGTNVSAEWLLSWVSFALLLCGMAALFFVSWRRRHAVR